MDAPVSGGDVGAKNATLSIMVGGDKEVVEALAPCFNAMGKTIVYQGGPGAGQHTKMVNQILIATNMIGVCEALLYGYKAGLDLPTVMQSVGSGAAGSWSLANLGPRIMNDNFDPGFFVEHFIKDMGIALAEARRMGLSLPGLALAHQLYVAVKAQGYGRNGTHALELALAQLSGINWKERHHGVNETGGHEGRAFRRADRRPGDAVSRRRGGRGRLAQAGRLSCRIGDRLRESRRHDRGKSHAFA